MTRTFVALMLCSAARLAGAQAAPPEAVAPPLFYAVVADTQKPDGDPYSDFAWAVAQVNEIAPRFTLMPGDLTNTGSVDQFRNFMTVAKGLRTPVHYAVGNHEGGVGEKVYRERFTEQTGQPPFYHRRIGGWHLLVLDSVRFVDGKLQHDGEIDSEQLAWLARELKSIPRDAPILLSLHHPFIRHDGLTNYPAVLKLVSGHWLVYTVTGHFHRNRHHQDADAVHHFTTGALSFSCSKACGIGYRLVSTVGQHLWTAWVETTDGKPLQHVRKVDGPGEVREAWPLSLPPAPDGGRVCLRLRYRGSGLSLTTPDAAGGSMSLALPEAQSITEAFVPVAPGVARVAISPSPEATGPAPTIGSLDLYTSTATWQHHRLRRPGETHCTITLHWPRAGSVLRRGRIPILGCIDRGAAEAEPALFIDGSPVEPDAGGFVAAIFRANGLQAKSHGFKNSLYANDELVSLLPADRNVLATEQFGYPIAPSLWRRQEGNPWFMLTAGTATDGTGANPPENNEDFVASEIVLYDGARYWCDEDVPLERSITVGDNKPELETYVKCHPTVSAQPDEWQAVLHAWDAGAVPPGNHTITVKARGASASVAVVVE